MERNELLVNILIKKGYTIAFAESCTGGLCAASLISVANASSVLNESFVTYANEAKIKYLDVDATTIDKFGVVSEEVAKEMAEGVANAANSNVGVGVSGIAGPTGGTKNKPVGMVCFGFTINGKTITKTQYFREIGRNNVRNKSVEFVFETLIELLK
jgi:PncC family amidohydrolase